MYAGFVEAGTSMAKALRKGRARMTDCLTNRYAGRLIDRAAGRLSAGYAAFSERCQAIFCMTSIRGDRLLRDMRGQGTTEYAILVGVLVVVAIIAVVAFRGKLQELWTSISEGVNSL